MHMAQRSHDVLPADTTATLAPNHRLGQPLPERVAVFRALQLGDLLCAVPALRALRAALPHARITLIGLPWARAFAHRFAHYVDDFLAFPGGGGLPERMAGTRETDEFYACAQAADFDLAIQLHGNGERSNAIVQRLGARTVAGFHRPGERAPEPERFVSYPGHLSEVRRLLALMEFLGAPAQGHALEFPILAEEWRQAAELRAAYGLRPGEYACVHAGARVPARRWPAERFAAVADLLAAQGLRIVLTGTEEEGDVTAAVGRSMHTGLVNLAGRTSLGVLAALLTGTRLLVCNDTGISHVAAALRVQSVVIYTGSSPERWAAAEDARQRAVYAQVECRPCEYRECPIGHPCAKGVGVMTVWREAEALLSGRPLSRVAV